MIQQSEHDFRVRLNKFVDDDDMPEVLELIASHTAQAAKTDTDRLDKIESLVSKLSTEVIFFES